MTGIVLKAFPELFAIGVIAFKYRRIMVYGILHGAITHELHGRERCFDDMDLRENLYHFIFIQYAVAPLRIIAIFAGR
jgi:hypothetical protein